MTRIKISDLPEEKKISREELRTIMGGGIAPSGMFEIGQTSMCDPQIKASCVLYASVARVPLQTDPSRLMK